MSQPKIMQDHASKKHLEESDRKEFFSAFVFALLVVCIMAFVMLMFC